MDVGDSPMLKHSPDETQFRRDEHLFGCPRKHRCAAKLGVVVADRDTTRALVDTAAVEVPEGVTDDVTLYEYHSVATQVVATVAEAPFCVFDAVVHGRQLRLPIRVVCCAKHVARVEVECRGYSVSNGDGFCASFAAFPQARRTQFPNLKRLFLRANGVDDRADRAEWLRVEYVTLLWRTIPGLHLAYHV